jgi:hypothetical protein
MKPILFCNVGWMARYAGLSHQPDRIVGGGSHVDESGTGHEVCNFVRCPDGRLYGHVETIRGEVDRAIEIANLGATATADWVDGVDVVWTAKHPQEGGRRVVGWYRNARVYRRRRIIENLRPKPRLTLQHKRDQIWSYIIETAAGNEHLLPLEERVMRLERGKGWMGQTQWWLPDTEANANVRKFVRHVRSRIDASCATGLRFKKVETDAGPRVGGASLSPHQEFARAVEKYEAKILPLHRNLQDVFAKFCVQRGFKLEKPPLNIPLDGCFRDKDNRLYFAEMKPCGVSTVRHAVRTAMGQLLDYSQHESPDFKVIVLDTVPGANEINLALESGFAIAFPQNGAPKKFAIRLPKDR